MYARNCALTQSRISCNFQDFSNLFVSEGLSTGLIQSWTVTFLSQSLVLQQVSDFKFSLIVRSVGLVFVFASVICFFLSTQDFLLGILAALFYQGRKIEFNLCVNLAFGDFLFAWQNRFLWPSTSLFHESCCLTLSWNLSFWSFSFSLPRFSLLLLIVKSDFKHIYFCWVFIH